MTRLEALRDHAVARRTERLGLGVPNAADVSRADLGAALLLLVFAAALAFLAVLGGVVF